jgi:CYTH domain-containing protein
MGQVMQAIAQYKHTKGNHLEELKRMTAQRIGKYACLEVECRYLLKRVPENLLAHPPGWLITDQYFPNTRLRLRHMESGTGKENIYKLTQKYRAETQNAYETTVTNTYLTEAEYHYFASLEVKSLLKRRSPLIVNGRFFSLDVFEGRHQGLILAEIELESRREAEALALPSFAFKDVTDDPFFTGGNLVIMTGEEFTYGLSERMGDHEK